MSDWLVTRFRSYPVRLRRDGLALLLLCSLLVAAPAVCLPWGFAQDVPKDVPQNVPQDVPQDVPQNVPPARSQDVPPQATPSPEQAEAPEKANTLAAEPEQEPAQTAHATAPPKPEQASQPDTVQDMPPIARPQPSVALPSDVPDVADVADVPNSPAVPAVADSPAVPAIPRELAQASPSPAQTLATSPAQTLASSPGQTLAPSPAQTPAPSPAQTLATSPAPSPAQTLAPAESAPSAQPAGTAAKDESPKRADKRIQLFGTVEFKGNLKSLPQWRNAMEAHAQNNIFSTDTKLNASTHWNSFKSSLLKKSPRDQLKAVNAFWNQWPYRQDEDVYHKPDFWAAPYLFRKNSGDCEDYCIVKYFTLRELGYPAEQLRIVIVMEKIRNIAHAVLVVFMDDDALVLDNLNSNVLSHSRLKNYAPQYSVNEHFRWAHVRPK